MMHIAQTRNNGRSDRLIFKSFLSVKKIAIRIGITAIENLKNSSVVWSIPLYVSVRTKIPLDPNMIPARMGKNK